MGEKGRKKKNEPLAKFFEPGMTLETSPPVPPRVCPKTERAERINRERSCVWLSLGGECPPSADGQDQKCDCVKLLRETHTREAHVGELRSSWGHREEDRLVFSWPGVLDVGRELSIM